MSEILQNVSEFPKTARVSERVHRVLGMNPSPFTGPGTNTYLVGMNGDRPLIIDTGMGRPEWLELLRAHLAECGNPTLDRCLMTHGHPDHVGGGNQLQSLFPEITSFKHPWPEVDAGHGLDFTPIQHGECFEGGADYTLQAVFSPGHAPDHMCFLLTNEDEKALFTGDVILGVGTTVIPRTGGDLGAYLNTLRHLLELDVDRIYPGHGPVIENPQEKITFYLEHRLERETQILTELQGGAKSVTAIVKSIYRDYPENLHAAAGQSVTSHLDKLEAEGRVHHDRDNPSVYTLIG